MLDLSQVSSTSAYLFRRDRLGAGFHPELTRRENVFLYASLMGLSRAQLRASYEPFYSALGPASAGRSLPRWRFQVW